VIAGHTQIMFSAVASAAAQIKAGQLRPLAVTGKTRSAIFDYRSANGAPERLPQLAADAVRASPDVLVSRGPVGTSQIRPTRRYEFVRVHLSSIP
jgi:hypothetical protein